MLQTSCHWQISPTILSQLTVAFHLLPLAGTSTLKAATLAKPQSPEKRPRSANQGRGKRKGKSRKRRQGAQSANCTNWQSIGNGPEEEIVCHSICQPGAMLPNQEKPAPEVYTFAQNQGVASTTLTSRSSLK